MVYLAREQEVFVLLAGGKIQKKHRLGASPSRVYFRIGLGTGERLFILIRCVKIDTCMAGEQQPYS